MKYYSMKKREDIVSPKVDSFLAEIHEVCKKFGFYIDHEDCQGSFIIEKHAGFDFLYPEAVMIGETLDENDLKEIT